MSDTERLSALRDHYSQLVTVHGELSDRLESVRAQQEELQAKVDELQRENETLKTSSLYVASVEEVLDDEVIIKQHGNNQVIVTEVSPALHDQLGTGNRVAVNDSFSIQTLLTNEADVRARAMEVTERPEVTYDDVGGLADQVREVRETVELPLESPEVFDSVGVDPPSGVLLYGPPGTGKTLLAKAVAGETNATFIRMSGSELVHKFIGEGARLVRDLFELAESYDSAIVFIDEIDAIASRRTDSKTSGDAEVQRTMMQLLANMDGFDDRGEVRIMAATNRFDMLDRAILRPGRFDRLIEVALPSEEARAEIFRIHSRGMSVGDGVGFGELARVSGGLSGADIKAVCTEAGMEAIRDDRDIVELADFHTAITKIKEDGHSGPVVTDGAPAFY